MQYTNYKNIKKLALCIIAFEGTEHLYNIISELRQSVDFVSIGLQRLSYHGDHISNIDLQEIFRLRDEDHLVDNIVEVELDTTKAPRVQETDKRNILIQDAEDHGCTHAIVIDSDEYYTRKSFEDACKKIDENNYEITYCQYINYYHDYKHFLVYPFKQGMYVPFVTRVKYRHSFECTDFTLPSDPTRRFVRPVKGVEKVTRPDGTIQEVKKYAVDYHVFPWNEVKMHHLSWLRADIRKKLNMWSSKKCFEHYNDLIDRAVESFENFDENSQQAKALMLFNTPGNQVDVKAFPKQYIHPKVDFNTRLRKAHNYKKLLVLSMSANLPLFNQLEETSNKTWRNIDHEKYPNIDVEFWTYTDAEEGKDTYIDKDKHVIYIKCDYTKERLYATFSKTILAIREIKKLNIDYDYIIRTNNSTWLNIPLLNEFLSYQENDANIYTGRVFSAFWSAFNLYGGGELIILSKRNVDILDDMSSDPYAIENESPGCDDNLLFGQWNKRMVCLRLYQHNYLHSLNIKYFIDKTINDSDIDFSIPAIQIKTYIKDSSKPYEYRLNYDCQKMIYVDELWKNNNESIEYLYNKLMIDYDKYIDIFKYNKQQWFTEVPDELKNTLKWQSETLHLKNDETLHWLQVRQKECGYQQTLI